MQEVINAFLEKGIAPAAVKEAVMKTTPEEDTPKLNDFSDCPVAKILRQST